MLGLYNKIWVDAIVSTKEKRTEADSWRLYTLVPLSLLMGINMFTLFLWMKTLVNRNLPLALPVNIFNALLINYFISVVVTFFIPFLLLNYLLIFNNNRYSDLLTRYDAQGGRLYKKYALISLGLLIIPVIIGKLFF